MITSVSRDSPFIHPESYLLKHYSRPPPEVIREQIYKDQHAKEAHDAGKKWATFARNTRSAGSVPSWLKHPHKTHKHEPDEEDAGTHVTKQKRLQSWSAHPDDDSVIVDAAKLFHVTSRFLQKYEPTNEETRPDDLDEFSQTDGINLYAGWDKDDPDEVEDSKVGASKPTSAHSTKATGQLVRTESGKEDRTDQAIRFEPPLADPDAAHEAFMRCVKSCIIRGKDAESVRKTPTSSRPVSGTHLSRRSSVSEKLVRSRTISASAPSISRTDRISALARPKSRLGTGDMSVGAIDSSGRGRQGPKPTSASSPSRPLSTATTTRSPSSLSARKRSPTLTPEQAEMVHRYTLASKDKINPRPATLADWHREQAAKGVIWDPSAFSVQRFIRDFINIQKASAEALRMRKNILQPSAASARPSVHVDPNHRRTALPTTFDSRRSGFNNHDRSEHQAAVSILRKSRFERTGDDIKQLYRYMRRIKAFAKLSDFILNQLCAVVHFQAFAKDRAVFRQGEIGTAWYIILTGSVVVQVSSTSRIEDSVPVTRLYAGEGFGDVALTNDRPRGATIITAEPCELIYIEKEDYKAFSFIHEKEIKEKMMFLRKVSLFRDWAAPSLRSVAQIMNWRKHLPGSVILQEGAPVDEFFIIRTGSCTVHRNLPATDLASSHPRPLTVQVGIVPTLSYFGSEGVTQDLSSQTPAISRYTIRASHEGIVETAVMTIYDARTNFRSAVEDVQFPGHNDDSELIRLYEEKIAKKKWDKMRKGIVRGLIKEWSGDPTASNDYSILKNEPGEKRGKTWRV
ncbi:uncharacterized protein SPPG_02724 [Spizellomyces punctatus DAOM BR117]|uniref:Cyclic nucleotide-binding domain-containing protein n=1 Tax=Spizellomyces punctatus (strain DAOM BR117) TaxID=645134 RepID=A0A0L0HME4_SPIPD|nr:uncharacterized protein SPPG_02724 [Spizellomyces punctatus DAOM BR117]KND02243.1 hypothetical protein SPPG_02724 [Spizellomyces punctatus DAOM BR117]|eukprot:XP_016610282.1 hypothetical protein SPPG_02724 [Spizellomyces punctatus DAOM BR117]